MTEYDYWKILKWVLIVLLAGFIGQFGKSLAKYLMERAKRKKESAAETPKVTGMPAPESSASYGSPHAATAVELTEKEETTKPEDKMESESAKEAAKIRKKELKALTKQQKKAAKSGNND